MNNIKSLLAIIFIAISSLAFAQNGEVRGTVYDGEYPTDGATVRILDGEQDLGWMTTGEDGTFGFKLIPAGRYTLEIIFIGKTKNFPLTVRSGKLSMSEYQISSEKRLGTYTVTAKAARLTPDVDDEPLDSIIDKGPTQDPVSTITQIPNLNPRGNGGFNSNGGRQGGTQSFVDGMPNNGLLGLGFDVQNISVQASGIPARYGGFSAAGINFTTVMPSVNRQIRFDMTSSALTSPYAQNRFHSFVSAPIITRTISDSTSKRKRKRLVLGYTWANYITYNKDNRPLYGGIDLLDQDALAELQNNPLTSSEQVGGYVMASNFINANDVISQNAQNNASLFNASTRFKLAYTPSKRMSLVLSARGGYGRQQLVSLSNMLLNSDRNPLRVTGSYVLGLDFNQTIKAPYDERGRSTRDSSDLFSHVYYTVKGTYQSNYSQTMDPIHRDRIFDYGNIGRFTTFSAPVYEYRDLERTVRDQHGNLVKIRGYHELVGYRDTGLTFESSNKNPLLSRINEQIFDLTGSTISNMTDFEESAGVRNGFNPQSLYAMYNNPGTITTNYQKVHNERFTLLAFGEAAFHPFRNHKIQHDLQFGVQFDQFSQSYYSLAAQRLWQLMPLLANGHISERDLQNPILMYDETGRFMDTVTYERRLLLEDQKFFDKNLREKLMADGATDVYGNPITQTSVIDVNSLDPSVYNLNMFSADELLNDGNSYVAYSGYDHLGNRRRGKTSLNDFLNNPLERPMDSYTPNYAAMWFQDKFAYRKMIMRLGMRIERFDANQAVLKDPYSFFPVRSAGEVTHMNGLAVDIPANIGEDFAVYVNNMDNPTKIVGFRDGHEWYDADGIRVNDPTQLALATSNGQIQPYLVDPENQTINKGSFASYDPAITVMPRVFFSFPINTEAVFFASYDRLAQRPPDAQSYVPLSTYYNIQAFTNSVIPNANMRPRIRTAYEVGFKQLIGDRSQLELKTSYATIQNDFNQVRLQEAYPFSYTTYSNVDFATIKSYSMQYEYDGPILDLMGSYSLQFADGTGSNINSASTLLQSGQPNLRSLYPLSFDIRHSLKGTAILHLSNMAPAKGEGILSRIFTNAYMSTNIRSLSGTPYTAIAAPVPEVQAVTTRTQIQGQPFGSRLPWQHNMDFKYEKNIPLSVVMVNERPRIKNSVSLYVMVSNILNTQQIFSVYPYTGSALDDGYLNSPQGQQNVEAQLSAEAFTQLYKLRMDNPYNMAQPRQVRLGVKLNFM